jgi:hypothetical protein
VCEKRAEALSNQGNMRKTALDPLFSLPRKNVLASAYSKERLFANGGIYDKKAI